MGGLQNWPPFGTHEERLFEFATNGRSASDLTDLEETDEFRERRGFFCQRTACACGLLGHGGVLLCRLIHLVDRDVYLLNPVACSCAPLAISSTTVMISATLEAIRVSEAPVSATSSTPLFDFAIRGRDQSLDLLGRIGRPLREGAHLGGHHREASARLSRPAASTPAFSARRLVWKAISSITPMIWLIS